MPHWMFVPTVLLLALSSCSNKRSSPVGDASGIEDAEIDQQLPDASVDRTVKPPPPPACDPCTDPTDCCKPEDMVCKGDPDKGVICSCPGLWACDEDGCSQPKPDPNEHDWNCQWSPSVYACSLPGVAASAPVVDAAWSCDYDAASSLWTCETTALNPCNVDGTTAWTCEVDNDDDLLTCTGGTPPEPQPTCGTWTCGPMGCNRDDQIGLPTPGDDWTCHRATIDGKRQWVCRGPAPSPPGGEQWHCQLAAAGIYRCTSDIDDCVPSDDRMWACYKGSAFDGTRCELLHPDDECFAGQNRWCEPLSFDGWGMVACQNGKWPTTTVNGKPTLDCSPLSSGAVPATSCACYHAFFNPDCCERDDCVVPMGGSQQFCPASPGMACDYCSPNSSECIDLGAVCAISNTLETYCTKPCSPSGGCSADFICMPIKVKNEVTKVCVPSDLSCYY